MGEDGAQVSDLVFQYVGCFRDNEGARQMQGNGGAITAVSTVPVAAAQDCASVCDGYTYFGLQWSNECFCDNTYDEAGRGNNQNQADCPGGECPLLDHCDADGVLDDDGTASLCANGQGNCGNRNAVYCVKDGAQVSDLVFQYVGCFRDNEGARQM